MWVGLMMDMGGVKECKWLMMDIGGVNDVYIDMISWSKCSYIKPCFQQSIVLYSPSYYH